MFGTGKEENDYKFLRDVFEKNPEALTRLIFENRNNGNFFVRDDIKEMLRHNNYEFLQTNPQVVKQMIVSGASKDYMFDDNIIGLLKIKPELFRDIFTMDQNIGNRDNQKVQEWLNQKMYNLIKEAPECVKYADVKTQIQMFSRDSKLLPELSEEAVLQEAKRLYTANKKDWLKSFRKISGDISTLSEDLQLKLVAINQDYLADVSDSVKNRFANGNPLLGQVAHEHDKPDDIYYGGKNPQVSMDASTLLEAFPQKIVSSFQIDETVQADVMKILNEKAQVIGAGKLPVENPRSINQRVMAMLLDEKICANDECRQSLISCINTPSAMVYGLKEVVEKAYGIEVDKDDPRLNSMNLCLFDPKFNERFSYDLELAGIVADYGVNGSSFQKNGYGNYWYGNSIASLVKHPERVEEYDRFCDLIGPAFDVSENQYDLERRNYLSPKKMMAFYASRDLIHSLDEEPTLSRLQKEKEELTPEENESLAKKRAEMLDLAVKDRTGNRAHEYLPSQGTRECGEMPFPKTLDELENYAQRRHEFYRDAIEKLTTPEDVARLIVDCYSANPNDREFSKPTLGGKNLADIRDVDELKSLFKKLSVKLQPGQTFEDLSQEDKANIFEGKDNEINNR